MFTAGAGREIDRYHAHPAKVKAQITSFRVDLGDAQARDNVVRLVSAVRAYAAVSFFFSTMKMTVIAVRRYYFPSNISGLRFQLLHAYDVCFLRGQPLKKTLVCGRAYAVQVNRYNSHIYLLGFVIAMSNFRQEFIEFAISRQVLCFGEFKTKAGRMSPYFFNAGLFNDGDSLRRLGQFYAKAILAAQLPFDMLFGSAYKGIPLVSAIAIELAEGGYNYPFCFNRKEVKDHGEGGNLVGAPLAGRVLMVDDVISAGTSVRESVGYILGSGAIPGGLIIALDRMERGSGMLSAMQEVRHEFGINGTSIINLDTIISYLRDRKDLAQNLRAMEEYRARYGVNQSGIA
jgi:orotate phosphoribosyltransferase